MISSKCFLKEPEMTIVGLRAKLGIHSEKKTVIYTATSRSIDVSQGNLT